MVHVSKVRTLSDGRHPEHGKTGYTKKHAVDGRQLVAQGFCVHLRTSTGLFFLWQDEQKRRYYQTLLMEAERRGDVQKQAKGLYVCCCCYGCPMAFLAEVFLWKQMAADFYSRNLRTACLNCAMASRSSLYRASVRLIGLLGGTRC